MDDDMTPLRLKRAYGGTHKVHPIAAVCTTGIWPAVSARHGQRKARGASRPSFGDSNRLSRVLSSAIVGARAMLHELVRLGYCTCSHRTSRGFGSCPVLQSVPHTPCLVDHGALTVGGPGGGVCWVSINRSS